MRKLTSIAWLILLTITVAAQKKQYSSFSEAFFAGMSLRGDRGPSGVQWIEDSDMYSFTKSEARSKQIWTYDIKTEEEEMVFSESDHTFPGTDIPFKYRSFQWTRDYQYLLFQSNFERIWRNSGNADYYLENAEAYLKKLEDLDTWIREELDNIPEENRELVSDHSSLGYFADEYGLRQIGAVIPAMTTEAETSGQQLAVLIETIREQQAKAIFVSVDFDPTLAQRVSDETGIELVVLYFGSLSDGPPADTYLNFMRYNIKTIVSALR